jgi:C-terminal peptidase prc
MVASLNDKYSRMLSRDQYSAIQKYDLIGVGVTLMPDSNKNIIVGAPPIPNSEAARVGMQVGDYVTEINGVSTAGRTAFDIIDQISEDPSAKTVTMTVRPKGSTAADPVKVVSMSRAFAAVKNPVQYKISETRSDGTKVGYIRISEFNALVKASLEKALSDLETAGVNAYVIDIRQNTGGAFQSAVEISSLFTEGRVATYVVDNTNVKLPFRTATGQLAIDSTDPIVMLIDGRSASASEVLAGSLHDNCRAVLMGEKSFGKGLIQAVYGLKNGEGLVMTVARYITPSGSDIQGVGITPDFPTSPSSYLGPLRNIGTISFGMDMDTTKIDFKSIQSRLQNVCKIPDEMK